LLKLAKVCKIKGAAMSEFQYPAWFVTMGKESQAEYCYATHNDPEKMSQYRLRLSIAWLEKNNYKNMASKCITYLTNLNGLSSLTTKSSSDNSISEALNKSRNY
jgi:hypothetical protein